MKNRVWSDRNFNVCENIAYLASDKCREVRWKKWDVFAVRQSMILSMGKIYGSINILPRWFIFHTRSGNSCQILCALCVHISDRDPLKREGKENNFGVQTMLCSSFIAQRYDRKTCGRYLIKIPLEQRWAAYKRTRCNTPLAGIIIIGAFRTRCFGIETDLIWFRSFSGTLSLLMAFKFNCHFRDTLSPTQPNREREGERDYHFIENGNRKDENHMPKSQKQLITTNLMSFEIFVCSFAAACANAQKNGRN